MWTRLLLVGTFACAALPARADLIYACVNNSSGTIKIVAQADVCPTNSAKTSLSTTAPEPPPSSDVYAERIHPPIEFTSGGNAAVVAELVDLPPGQYLLLAHISEIDSSPPGTNIASVVY
jgi:hypothetical protein